MIPFKWTFLAVLENDTGSEHTGDGKYMRALFECIIWLQKRIKDFQY